MITLAIVSIFLSFVCLLYSIHMSIVYSNFNNGIKDWTQQLDDAMEISINRAARKILRDMDDKITEINSNNDSKNVNEDGKE